MQELAARAAALPPRRQDAALAAALLIVDIAVLLAYRAHVHPLAAAIALVALQNIPLAWRRSWPVAVLSVIGCARVCYDLIGLHYAPLPLGPAIGYYTVMSRCSPRIRQLTTVLALAAILVSQSAPGHTEPYDLVVAVLIFAAAGTAGALSRTRRAFLEAAEFRAAWAEHERDRDVAGAAAAERARIARELHDVVAHHVSLIAVQAEAAASLLPGRPEDARRSVDVIGDTARQALTELRRLLGVLRGPAEQLQVAPSPSLGELGAVLDQVRGAGMRVELRVEGRPCELAPGIDVAAYRIVQEALTNALRHSPGESAVVTLCYEPGYVTVRVADPATPVPHTGAVPVAAARLASEATAGTAPDRVPHSAATGRDAAGAGGFGLAGIAERVASCGGSLAVGPTPAGGFAVTARLPAR